MSQDPAHVPVDEHRPRRSLEWESKRLLATWGLRIPAGRLATNAREASAIAAQLEPPFAVKVQIEGVVHKTELRGVHLDLEDPAAVAWAVETIRGDLPASVQPERVAGFLVEEMIDGGLEVLIGTVTDPTFGRFISVALGGLFVEVLDDVAFRHVPIHTVDAHDLLDELRSRPLIDGWRGSPGLRDTVVDVLMSVAGPTGVLETAHPRIAELEFNPVIVRPDGAWIADASLSLA